MRRRIVPAAVALLVLGVIALLGRRRRSARGVAAAEHGAIPQRTVDRKALPQPQVEPEEGPLAEVETPVMETAPAPARDERRETAGGTPRFLSIPWSTHPDPPPPDTTELQIHCTLTAATMELARVDVRETASQVFVTVLARWRPHAPASRASGASGTSDAAEAAPPPDLKRTATAPLRAPLGDRALVHAPHDDAPR